MSESLEKFEKKIDLRNIQFEDIDVSVNREIADEMVKKSGQMGVPVLDIDGQIIVGFDKEAIKKILNL